MNIPNHVRIHGIDYSIHTESVITRDGQELYGEIRFNEADIAISSVCQNQQIAEITLLHEILHGIQNANGMEIEDEEAVIDMFAKGIYQVIKDNPKLFKDGVE